MNTVYPIGTIVNCNRCDAQFKLMRTRRGHALQTTAARLQDFERCPICTTRDAHWIYARNNPNMIELHYVQSLCAFTFEDPTQTQTCAEYMRARNIFLNRKTLYTLVARDAADCEAVLRALAEYERQRTSHPI